MRQKITKLSIVLGILSLVLVAVITIAPNDQYRVIFCDVGQGDAILITAPNNIQILIDGGPNQKILEKLGKYMPFNDRTIEAVIVTHPHADHLAGLLEVAKRYEILQVIETDMPDADTLSLAWEDILRQREIAVVRGRTGQTWQFDKNLSLKILYASEQSAESIKDLNELSIVSIIEIQGRRFLLTGDMTQVTEKIIMAEGHSVKVDVLKVSHHGSRAATLPEWLKLIRPSQAVITVGQPNRYGHPAPEVLTRLMQQNILYWRTDQSGDIRMILKNGTWVTKTDNNAIMQ